MAEGGSLADFSDDSIPRTRQPLPYVPRIRNRSGVYAPSFHDVNNQRASAPDVLDPNGVDTFLTVDEYPEEDNDADSLDDNCPPSLYNHPRAPVLPNTYLADNSEHSHGLPDLSSRQLIDALSSMELHGKQGHSHQPYSSPRQPRRPELVLEQADSRQDLHPRTPVEPSNNFDREQDPHRRTMVPPTSFRSDRRESQHNQPPELPLRSQYAEGQATNSSYHHAHHNDQQRPLQSPIIHSDGEHAQDDVYHHPLRSQVPPVWSPSMYDERDSRPRQVVLQQELPKAPIFSGHIPVKPGSGETSYEEWRYEVDMLLREDSTYPSSYIRKSLRGEAKKLTMRCSNTKEIIQKLDTFYGSVDDGVQLLQKFYSCRQNKGEAARSFYYRLEDLLHKARDKGEIFEPQATHKLRDVFWKGLNNTGIKAALHHHYEAKAHPEKLLRLVREMEEAAPLSASEPSKSRATVHQQMTSPQLPATAPPPLKENGEFICFLCKLPGHIARGCRNYHLWRDPPNRRKRQQSRPNPSNNGKHLNFRKPLPRAEGQWPSPAQMVNTNQMYYHQQPAEQFPSHMHRPNFNQIPNQQQQPNFNQTNPQPPLQANNQWQVNHGLPHQQNQYPQ